jgi:hypothetical protein
MAKNLIQLGQTFQFVAETIITKNIPFQVYQHNLKEKVYISINSMIEMLSMFENTLSERKQKMLEIYRKIIE